MPLNALSISWHHCCHPCHIIPTYQLLLFSYAKIRFFRAWRHKWRHKHPIKTSKNVASKHSFYNVLRVGVASVVRELSPTSCRKADISASAVPKRNRSSNSWCPEASWQCFVHSCPRQESSRRGCWNHRRAVSDRDDEATAVATAGRQRHRQRRHV